MNLTCIHAPAAVLRFGWLNTCPSSSSPTFLSEFELHEEAEVSVKLNSRQVGDVTVIDAAGRITLGEGASAFRDTIRDFASKGNKKLLLNLGDVSYIDSSGIGEMVSGFTTVTNNGGQMKLVGLSKRIKDLLQITKLYTVFDVYDDEAQAVRSFS